MDRPTLDWIAAHRPTAPPPVTEPLRRALMLLPEPAWFARPGAADSLHGVGHNARVSLLTAVLAEYADLDRDSTTSLCAAAAIHDCRRRDDRTDPGHGERAATWLLRNRYAVTAALGLREPLWMLSRAAVAVEFHDVPYDAFTAAQARAYRQSSQLVDLLKAADCLDRYRLPLARWWPDLSRLRVPVPDWLPPAAFELMLRSEQARLNGATHQQALDHARRTVTAGGDR